MCDSNFVSVCVCMCLCIQLATKAILKYCLRGLCGGTQRNTLFYFFDTLTQLDPGSRNSVLFHHTFCVCHQVLHTVQIEVTLLVGSTCNGVKFFYSIGRYVKVALCTRILIWEE